MFRQIATQLGRSLDLKLATVRSLTTTDKLNKTEKELPKKQEPTDKPPEPKFILLEKDENITLIGINRPDRRNAIHSKAAVQLCDAFRKFEEDATSPVAVIYGVGGSFCSGFDIFELDTDSAEKLSLDILMTQEGSIGPTRRTISKPVICGINGYCVANGLELALMCDLRVMEESAILGFFNRRFGVPVIDGGTVRLPAMIGISRALDLILTGRHVYAEEACQTGIANRIVPTGSALNEAIKLAKTLAKFPQSALNHDRNSLYSAVYGGNNFTSSIQNEIMYTSKDIITEMHEGIKWFNRTFEKKDEKYTWLTRQKSMADWDDKDVSAAADVKEAQKKAKDVQRILDEKKHKEEKQKESEKDSNSPPKKN